METWFLVDKLDVEKLLVEWRWLCPDPMALVAKNAFGDLFLRDKMGNLFQLDVAVGKLIEIAASEAEFRELAKTREKREEWFAESDEQAASAKGLNPNSNQCIGFTVPTVFAESGFANKPYVVDIYDHVAFLGDVHRQISTLPDGAKVRLKVQPQQ
jgi:hypothetical protein